MKNICVSLFASAIRKKLFKEFLDSLKHTTVSYEVVFAGTLTDQDLAEFKDYPELKYIKTENVKPAQCYEIARRNCVGNLVHWCADDAVFSGDILGNAYRYWESKENRKLILSLQTKENGILCDMKDHRFFGFDQNTPLMAPLALLSREYLEELGGLDRRFSTGQWENDLACLALADGATVEIFTGQGLITLDHYQKHGVDRPFALGYPYDRAILEKIWCINGKIDKDNLKRNYERELFEEKDLLKKSQGYIDNSIKGVWL
jgi:hypothetical protein